MHIIARVAVAEALREDLVEDRLFHPLGLDVIAQQHEIVGVVRDAGVDAVLVVIVDAAVGHQTKVIVHAVFPHGKRTGPVDEALLPFLLP